MAFVERVDLLPLIYIPVAFPKRSKINLTLSTSSGCPLQKIGASSTKRRWIVLKIEEM